MFSFGGSSSGSDPDKDKNNKPSNADQLAKSAFDNTDAQKAPSTGFDPTGLERAAKAARELQDLKFAPEAISIAKQQEKSKQLDSQKQIEENRTQQKAIEAQRVKIEHEERRKTIDQEAKARQQNAYYQDQLARKRQQDHVQQQRALKDEELRKQEESQRRIEALRRQTAEYEAKIRKQTEVARAEAEAKGKTKQERENWDLRMERSRMEQKEFRTTVLEGIKEAGKILGAGFKNYLQDREKLATTVGVLSLAALGIYTAKTSTAVAGRLLEARLSQPPLIRETNRLSFTRLISHPLSTLRTSFTTFSRADPSAVLNNVVLEQETHERLDKFAKATKNTLKNNSPFRNMLLYGPPGTGKTLFAKQLAKQVGLNYAILTGSDVLPLGKNAVTELHKLFDWAERSRKGLILFVDEAETFLRQRSSETGMSEESRNALNAFLYRTGTSSQKFMVVFATNQPDELDWAINDRTDELVKFDLPKSEERIKILKLYFDKLILKSHLKKGLFGGAKEIQVEIENAEQYLESLGKKLEGFSGRELNKLVIAWQATARGSLECILKQSDMDKIVQERIEQHKQKAKWTKQEIATHT